MTIVTIDVDRDGVALVVMNDPGRSMNVTSPELTQQLLAAFERVAMDPRIRGAILTSGKERSFVAGGDIKDFATAHDRGMTLAQAFALSNDWNVAFRWVETCGKPIAAALNGLALGGGFELALCCRYRVLADEPTAIVGLPEVTIGLIPAGGGTQRLPRLIGIDAALALMLEGKRIKPPEALALGIVHEVVPTERLIDAARRWVLANPDAKQPWDVDGYRIRAEADDAFTARAAQLTQQTGGNYPAPLALLSSVYEGIRLPIERGLRVESTYFATLLTGAVARNLMRTTFVNKRLADKLARRPNGVPKAHVSRLGVIGTSDEGDAIAERAARAGIDVVRSDDGRDIARSDLIVLAHRDPHTMLAHAEAVAAPHAIIASAIPISVAALARASKRPRELVGIGLRSPVDNASMIEIATGSETSRETVARAMDFAAQLRATPIVVNDAPGFYTERIGRAFIGETMRMVEEGVDRSLIDRAVDAAGLPRRLLALADDVSAVQERERATGERSDVEEIKQRLLYAMALEGARCLDEGIVTHTADADVAAVFGVGFPQWTGGPLSYIETVGLDPFVTQCARMAKRFGAQFRPPPGLIDRARRGETFYASNEGR